MKQLREVRESLPRAAEYHMALSDVNRLRMIRIIAAEKDVAVGEIAKRLGISQPAVSQHLRILKMIGLLVPERRGNQTLYHIDLEALEAYRNLENELYEVVLHQAEASKKKAAE